MRAQRRVALGEREGRRLLVRLLRLQSPQVNYAGGPAPTAPTGAPGAQPPGKTAAAKPVSPTMTASAAGVTP